MGHVLSSAAVAAEGKTAGGQGQTRKGLRCLVEGSDFSLKQTGVTGGIYQICNFKRIPSEERDLREQDRLQERRPVLSLLQGAG